jgi:alpha-amylase
MTSEVRASAETGTNVTLLEAWEWYAPADGGHYGRLKASCSALKQIGIDYLWLPPGCKAGHHASNGYDTYDLYDLGEFDQKDGRRTKWGDVEQLMELIGEARTRRLGLLWDAVLNHKAAADYVETCQAVAVDKESRSPSDEWESTDRFRPTEGDHSRT